MIFSKLFVSATTILSILFITSNAGAAIYDKTDTEVKAKCEQIISAQYPESTSKIALQKFEINQLQVMPINATVLGAQKSIQYACNVNLVLITTKRPLKNEKPATLVSREVFVISLSDDLQRSKLTKLPKFESDSEISVVESKRAEMSRSSCQRQTKWDVLACPKGTEGQQLITILRDEKCQVTKTLDSSQCLSLPKE